MVIVLLHCSTFIVVLNVALSSLKGLSFPLSQTTDIYVEKRRESQTYIYREAKGGEGPQASESSSHSSRALLPVLRAGGKSRSGYLTPAVSGSPTASERGTESEVAHKWARWLLRPSCCTACALRAHCVHTAHAEAGILTQEYLSPDWLHSEATKPT